MGISLTLSITVTDTEGAERAVQMIREAFNLDVPASLATNVHTVTTDTPDPASIGFGGSTPSTTVVTRDTNTGALVAHEVPGVELDADGLPHDPRIHSAGSSGNAKPKNADGRWKKKRGVLPAEVATVEAELRALMAIPSPGAVAPPPPPTAEVAPPPPPVMVQAPVPPAAAAPEVAPPPPVTTPTAPTTFAQFMAWLGPFMAAGKVTAPTVAQVMVDIGLKDADGTGQTMMLARRPDLIPSAHASLSAIIAAAG